MAAPYGNVKITVTVKLHLAPDERNGTAVRLTEVLLRDPLVTGCNLLASNHTSGTGTKTVVLSAIVVPGTVVQVSTVAYGNTASTDASEFLRAA